MSPSQDLPVLGAKERAQANEMLSLSLSLSLSDAAVLECLEGLKPTTR
jgi:hypothetical protein